MNGAGGASTLFCGLVRSRERGRSQREGRDKSFLLYRAFTEKGKVDRTRHDLEVVVNRNDDSLEGHGDLAQELISFGLA